MLSQSSKSAGSNEEMNAGVVGWQGVLVHGVDADVAEATRLHGGSVHD